AAGGDRSDRPGGSRTVKVACGRGSGRARRPASARRDRRRGDRAPQRPEGRWTDLAVDSQPVELLERTDAAVERGPEDRPRRNPVLACKGAVLVEERGGVLGGVRHRRKRARSAGAVLREPVAVRAVVDLEETSTVPAVADDVLHVRLPRRNREQDAVGEAVPLL